MNSCCCPDPIFIGCVSSCVPTTVLLAKQTGNHTVAFQFLEQDYYFVEFYELGDPFIFPNVFNEHSKPVFQITQPDGSDYELTEEDIAAFGLSGDNAPYECFTMEIKPTRLLNGTETPAVTPSCVMKLTPVGPERFIGSGDTVTVTAFALADTVDLDVYVDGRLVTPDVAGTIDLLTYTTSGQVITFSEDVTDAEILVKGIIQTEYEC